MPLCRLFVVLILALLCPRAVVAADGTFIPPEILSKGEWKYPASMGRKGREGYVTVRFTVLGDGSISDLEVVEATNGDFVENTLEFVKTFRFRPGSLDGRPVTVPDRTFRARFFIETSKGRTVSSDTILDLIREGEAAIRNGAMAAARQSIDRLYEKAKTLNDYAFIHSLDADWHVAAGQPWEAINLYGRLAEEVDAAFQVGDLQRRFLIEARMGLYGHAVATAKSIQKTAPDVPLAKAIAKAVDQMTALAASDKKMSVELPVTGRCYWRVECTEGQGYAVYRPMRRYVTLAGSGGAEVTARMHCGPIRQAIPTEPGVVWALPGAPGDCELMLVAPVGTVVTLVETHAPT